MFEKIFREVFGKTILKSPESGENTTKVLKNLICQCPRTWKVFLIYRAVTATVTFNKNIYNDFLL